MSETVATVCRSLGHLAEALLAQYASQQDPERASRCKLAAGHARLAEIHNDLGDMDEAIENIEQAQEIVMDLLKKEANQ